MAEKNDSKQQTSCELVCLWKLKQYAVCQFVITFVSSSNYSVCLNSITVYGQYLLQIVSNELIELKVYHCEWVVVCCTAESSCFQLTLRMNCAEQFSMGKRVKMCLFLQPNEYKYCGFFECLNETSTHHK